jgi:phasin
MNENNETAGFAPVEAPQADFARSVGDHSQPLAAPPDAVEVVEAIPGQIEEIGEVIQQSAELTLDQAKTSYERVRQAAEQTTSSIEAAVAATGSGVAELNMKAIDCFKTSTDAAFDFVRAMSGARTLSDIVSLHTEHLRKQVEMMNAHSREFAELANKVSTRAMAPLSETVAKTFGAAA